MTEAVENESNKDWIVHVENNAKPHSQMMGETTQMQLYKIRISRTTDTTSSNTCVIFYNGMILISRISAVI